MLVMFTTTIAYYPIPDIITTTYNVEINYVYDAR